MVRPNSLEAFAKLVENKLELTLLVCHEGTVISKQCLKNESLHCLCLCSEAAEVKQSIIQPKPQVDPSVQVSPSIVQDAGKEQVEEYLGDDSSFFHSVSNAKRS